VQYRRCVSGDEPGPEEFEAWYEEILRAWRETAPSYVHLNMTPLAGTLRDYRAKGMTLAQFREALEIAFAQRGVEKRRALAYAYGVVRRQLGESKS
jgi:hypothetical protein